MPQEEYFDLQFIGHPRARVMRMVVLSCGEFHLDALASDVLWISATTICASNKVCQCFLQFVLLIK